MRVIFATALACCAVLEAHAQANSCANLDVIGTFDQTTLTDHGFGIYAVGTFRIADETNEGKQPMFNLAMVNCAKQLGDTGKESLECKVMKAVVWATSEKPDTDKPNCSL